MSELLPYLALALVLAFGVWFLREQIRIGDEQRRRQEDEHERGIW